MGLLNEILEFLKNNFPFVKKIKPIIRNGGAPLIKEKLVPMKTEWINTELDKVTKGKDGSELDVITISYIKDYLIKEVGNKI